eukprot:scaffold42526_cov80-Phaeocystis_antarctica.AAC.1
MRGGAKKSIAGNNLRRMQRINSQDERVSLRVEGERTPERLQTAADAAARSGDLQTRVEYANGTRQTIQLWDQFHPVRSSSAKNDPKPDSLRARLLVVS